MTQLISKISSDHNHHVLEWEWKTFTCLPDIPKLNDILEYEMDYFTFIETTDKDKQIDLINKWMDIYAVYKDEIEMYGN